MAKNMYISQPYFTCNFVTPLTICRRYFSTSWNLYLSLRFLIHNSRNSVHSMPTKLLKQLVFSICTY